MDNSALMTPRYAVAQRGDVTADRPWCIIHIASGDITGLTRFKRKCDATRHLDARQRKPMIEKQMRYTFSVPTAEVDIETGLPMRDEWVRKFTTDAAAELFAGWISEDHGNIRVRIHRADATWSVSRP